MRKGSSSYFSCPSASLDHVNNAKMDEKYPQDVNNDDVALSPQLDDELT